jgi:hypothetical protein
MFNDRETRERERERGCAVREREEGREKGIFRGRVRG